MVACTVVLGPQLTARVFSFFSVTTLPCSCLRFLKLIIPKDGIPASIDSFDCYALTSQSKVFTVVGGYVRTGKHRQF